MELACTLIITLGVKILHARFIFNFSFNQLNVYVNYLLTILLEIMQKSDIFLNCSKIRSPT